MLEVKSWHNKTETKNVKVPKVVEFIKICDQYPRRFNFGNFFNSTILQVTDSMFVYHFIDPDLRGKKRGDSRKWRR